MNHYPHHIGDFAAATQGLSLAERGAYRALLDQYYAHEKPLPADKRECYRMAVCTTALERKAVDYVLPRYFVLMDDGWHQKRCDEEIQKYHDKAAKASNSAAIGWSKRNANASTDAMRTHSEGNANQNQNQNHEPVTKEKAKEASPLLSGKPDVSLNGHDSKAEKRTRLADEAKAILAFLNDRAGKKFPPSESNVGIVVARMKEGFTPAQVRQVIANRVRKWKGDEKMAEYLRPETLFGRTKFSGYVGELVDAPEDSDG